MVELIYAAKQIAGLDAHQALESVPYSWLLRFQTMLWYQNGLGASPRLTGRDEKRGRASEGLRS